MNPREIAAAVGRLTGRTDVTDVALSGRMTADEAAPLLAGMIVGVIREVFAPVVGAEQWTEFTPDVRPLRATVTMLDGSTITITLEADR